MFVFWAELLGWKYLAQKNRFWISANWLVDAEYARNRQKIFIYDVWNGESSFLFLLYILYLSVSGFTMIWIRHPSSKIFECGPTKLAKNRMAKRVLKTFQCNAVCSSGRMSPVKTRHSNLESREVSLVWCVDIGGVCVNASYKATSLTEESCIISERFRISDIQLNYISAIIGYEFIRSFQIRIRTNPELKW